MRNKTELLKLQETAGVRHLGELRLLKGIYKEELKEEKQHRRRLNKDTRLEKTLEHFKPSQWAH